MSSLGGTGDPPPILQPSSVPDSPPASKDSPPSIPRWRSVFALLLLALYVAVPALMGAQHSANDPALLPSTVRGILVVCATELILFGAVFVAVVALAGLGTNDLLLRWRGMWVVPRAVLWSIALRIAVGLALGLGLGLWHLLGGAPVESLNSIRPRVEAMVDITALQNPVYFALMLTLVSFVLAGLREELWRAGMISLLGKSAPGWFDGRGRWLALVPVALLFGMAHIPQGGFGVAATTVLGLGFGAVMLLHRSIWDAVLAHGFFNAATFALLPWLASQLPELTR